MLSTIKLDDRTYEDIREETIQNIVKHCPDWTNHNASDPGIALVELFASMTEMLQYRFNQIPHKNYIAFLDMLGINANMTSPAISRVAFNLVENFEQGQEKKSTKKISKGTQFITKNKEVQGRPLIFETILDTYISNITLKKIISKAYNTNKENKKYQFNTHSINSTFQPFKTFNGEEENTLIYLKDDEFNVLKSQNLLTLIFSLDIKKSTSNTTTWFQDIRWEYFNGNTWKKIKTIDTSSTIRTKYEENNAKYFFITLEGGISDFEQSIQEYASSEKKYYIRASIDIKNNPWLKHQNIKLYEIEKVITSAKNGIKPHKLFYQNIPITLDNKIFPFGEMPKEDDVFIISDNLFSKKGEDIIIDFKRQNFSENTFKIKWEYPIQEHDWLEVSLLEDSTDNLKDAGRIKLKIPENIHPTTINGEDSYAIRAKVIKEDYSLEQKKKEKELYEKSQKIENAHLNLNDIKLNLPYFHDIRISYSQNKELLNACYIYNNNNFIRKIKFNNDKKDNTKKNFLSENIESDTSLYLGFDSYLNKDSYLDLYIDITPLDIEIQPHLSKWEVYINKQWKELKLITDKTNSLTKSGDIRLKLPLLKNHEVLFDFEGMWIRIKFIDKDEAFLFPYKINNIRLNSAIVIQQETIKNEYIGISIGMPSMKFKLNHKNIVYPPILKIGKQKYHPLKKDERFIDYEDTDNIYKLNTLNGEILLGDNQYGSIPNPKQEIYAEEYAISFGENGNIGKEQLTLNQTIQSIQSATNIIAATGGTNSETLDNLIQRAPEILRIKNRIITAKDYEDASVDFSPYIIKAKAIPLSNNTIEVIVVTKDILEENSDKKVLLLEPLEENLKKMSLITVLPKVIVATVIHINIKIDLMSTVEGNKIDEGFKSKLQKEAYNYFNVTKKFPMGKLTISEADLYKILHNVSFEYYYKNIKIWEEGETEPDKSSIFELHNENQVIKLKSFEIEE